MSERQWMRRIAFATLLSSLSIYPAAAQPICQDILAGGAFRQLSRREDSYSSLVYASRLEQMSYQEAMRDFQANGGATIKGIPFSASMSEQQYNSNLQRLKRSVDLTTVRSNSTQLVVADGDPTIVSAWENCILRSTGIIATMRPLDAQIIELSITFRPFPNAPAPTIDHGTHVTNATILAGGEFLNLRSNTLGVANTRVITLRRTSPDAAVLAVINTTVGNATAYLPPRPRPTSPRTEPAVPLPIVLSAKDHDRSRAVAVKLSTDPENPNWEWGEAITSAPGSPVGLVYWNFNIPRAGIWAISIEYASAESRPVDVYMDQRQFASRVLVPTTQTFCVDRSNAPRYAVGGTTRSEEIGKPQLTQGVHTLHVAAGPVFPHIRSVRLTFLSDS